MSSGPLADSGYISCNCACQVCLSGGCCMDPNRRWFYPVTVTDTTIAWTPCASGHDFAPFNAVTLYCRKCGTHRTLDIATEEKP